MSESNPLDPKVRAEAAEWLRLYVTNQPRIAAMMQALLAAEQYERERADFLTDTLRKLANEASGFLGMADLGRHGHTNSRILRDRIEQARDTLTGIPQLPSVEKERTEKEFWLIAAAIAKAEAK